jgi:hypothetical protein
MCNLYSIITNQAAIIALFRVVNRYVGNLAPMPGVFPDYPAPVVRNTDTGRDLGMMRWGMPPPPRTGGPPVTNVRNTSSPHWRIWLTPENRCLVPFNISQPEVPHVPTSDAVMLTKVHIPQKLGREVMERLDAMNMSGTHLYDDHEGAAIDVINAYNYDRKSGRVWDLKAPSATWQPTKV